MAKMTKTQAKRAYAAIKSKIRKIWASNPGNPSSFTPTSKDMMAISDICDKYLKKMK